MKICEWRDMGYTQMQIAEGVGLSRSRVAQIVLEKCTQVQKTDTLKKKAKKNNVHRNTQAKIERIRKVAAGAAFPDMLDSTLAGVSRDVWKGIHRTVSHWPVLYPAILDFVVFSGAAIPESVFRLICAFLMGALVHISCDFLTPMGIPLYPPFTKRGRSN